MAGKKTIHGLHCSLICESVVCGLELPTPALSCFLVVTSHLTPSPCMLPVGWGWDGELFIQGSHLMDHRVFKAPRLPDGLVVGHTGYFVGGARLAC